MFHVEHRPTPTGRRSRRRRRARPGCCTPTGTGCPGPLHRRVLTVANQKGGVGKTTSTVNLAAALAMHGVRVLVVDLDPQGNASTALDVEHRSGTPSVYEVLLGEIPLAEAATQSSASENLLVRPGHDRPGRRRDRARLDGRPRAAAQAGAVARGARRAGRRLRPHRLPAVARPADGQRARRGRGGADPDPVRVLRAGGPRAAAEQHRPRAQPPQPRPARLDDPADDVRRPHQARRPGDQRGPQALRRHRAADRDPAQRQGVGGARLQPDGARVRPRLPRRDELRRRGPGDRRARCARGRNGRP